jgi:hypothetical protein
MFLLDQFDSVVTDSLAREYEARRVTVDCDFQESGGHREGQAGIAGA